jgi:calcineurin-like phosphoesterase family protein
MSDQTKVLRQFLQISDLHIDGDSPKDRKFPPLVQRLARRIPGLYGHDSSALQFLEVLFSELKRKGPAEVLFTGDLTRFGSVADFTAGEVFFDSRGGLKASLGVPGWRARAVAGNHDYWPGQLPHILGIPTHGLKRCFPFVYWVGRADRVSETHTLRFVGIDGDCDALMNGGLSRVLARGYFSKGLTELGGVLTPSPENEIRILLLHHSPRRERRITLGMSQESRRVLQEFVAQHNIRAILTGHLHHFYVGPSTFPNCFELRCGTSAQEVRPPAHWKMYLPDLLRPDPNRWEPQTALVHQILRRDGQLLWRAQVYWRRRDRFMPLDTLPAHEGSWNDLREPLCEFRLDG